MATNLKIMPGEGVPLARAYHLEELRGLIAKSMDVPAGRLGVVIYPGGRVRTFSPGIRRVLTSFERLRGLGIGLRAGYIPAGELSARVILEYLLSGDGDLLEGRLICTVNIQDPGRFFDEVVVPQGKIWSNEIDLDPRLIKDSLEAITPQYAAVDLVHGSLAGRLMSAVQSGLDAGLKNQGMQLKEIDLLTLWRAENRALIEEKAQALRERLQDVEIQKKMGEIENQAQLNEFIHQLEPELKDAANFYLGNDKQHEAKGPKKGKIAEAIRGWLAFDTSKEGHKRKWSLEELFRRKQETGEGPVWPTVRHAPRNWWLPRTSWMIFSVIVAWILTILIENNLKGSSLDAKIGLYVTIWGFAIGVVLDSLKVLYQKREMIAEASWPLAGHQHLDHLVRNDRPRADKLVREECTRELLHIRDVVSDVRSREYQRGKTDFALRLRNVVERNIEDCAEKVGRQDYGPAPYLTDLHISGNAWGRMLDYDEELLLYMKALSDEAHLLQEKSHANQLTDYMVSDLDAGISKFCNRFYERGRSLQMPAEDNKN